MPEMSFNPDDLQRTTLEAILWRGDEILEVISETNACQEIPLLQRGIAEGATHLEITDPDPDYPDNPPTRIPRERFQEILDKYIGYHVSNMARDNLSWDEEMATYGK